MIIAVSVLIAEFTARNNGGAARQESASQSATFHIAKSLCPKGKKTTTQQIDNENGILNLE